MAPFIQALVNRMQVGRQDRIAVGKMDRSGKGHSGFQIIHCAALHVGLDDLPFHAKV